MIRDASPKIVWDTVMSRSIKLDILLEQLGIATIDGNNFGSSNSYLRISCCTSRENINIALEKISNYFN